MQEVTQSPSVYFRNKEIVSNASCTDDDRSLLRRSSSSSICHKENPISPFRKVRFPFLTLSVSFDPFFSFSLYASVLSIVYLLAFPHALGNREINIVGASHVIANLCEEYGVKLGALLTSGTKGRRGPGRALYSRPIGRDIKN